MSQKLTVRVTALLAATALVLTGCAEDEPEATPGTTEATQATGAPEAGEDAQAILDRFDIEGNDGVEVVDYMDRLGGDDRPQELMASVRADELVLTTEDDEAAMPLPEDRFYISFAPYVDSTHDCFYHSLTTCQGELVEEDLDVRIVDETNNEVLVDETVTTFENGFYGIWVPRDIEGTIEVEYGDVSGDLSFATTSEAPTCLTTLELT